MTEEIINKLHIYPSGELEEFEQVQELVRCKECKYYKQSEAFCENGNGLWQAGDECFCSYGEREGE